MTPQTAPIGYWLKQADQALTDGIDSIQATHNLSRTDWQLLNTIQGTTLVHRHNLLDALLPFADQAAVDAILTRFTTEGLIMSPGETTFVLTQRGKDLHESCLNAQQSFRQIAMAGITDEAYQTTVTTLRKLVANLTVGDQ